MLFSYMEVPSKKNTQKNKQEKVKQNRQTKTVILTMPSLVGEIIFPLFSFLF